MNARTARVSRRRFLSIAGSIGGAACLGAFRSPALGQAKPLPIIDCHLHINHRNRSLEDTIRHMDVTGTDQAFILPLETGEGEVLLKSDTVLEAHRHYPDRIIPFCQCDVRQSDSLERIRRYRELGFRGVGEQKEHVRFGDRRIENLIALCDELDWPIVVHFQDGKKGYNQGMAEHLEAYLRRYQRVRIIGHAQTWWANISAEVPPPEETLYPKGPVKPGGLLDRLLADYPNLYADLSAGSGYNALTRDEDYTAGFFERHWKQLLFGTDCPCWDGRGGSGRGDKARGICYTTRLKDFLRRMIRNESMLKAIFHDNAKRVLESARSVSRNS